MSAEDNVDLKALGLDKLTMNGFRNRLPSCPVAFDILPLSHKSSTIPTNDDIDLKTLGLQKLTINDFGNSLPTYAIAFDIDGVLLRGKEPVDTAKCALELLQSKNIPYIMLTNGGGHTEKAHAELLSKRLGVAVDEDHFIQSHTPFKSFIKAHKDQWVLCLGGEKTNIKELAQAYGFSADRVLTSSDIIKMDPKIHPFGEMTHGHHMAHGKIDEKFRQEGQKIGAIFVFSSPRDWCLDIQVCLDLLASEGGRLNTRSSLNGNADVHNHGYQQDGQPMIHFCNPDLEWATSYPQPRIAQGAFRAALEGVWLKFTGGKAALQVWTCGKPTDTTYEYAENAIKQYRRKISAGSLAKITELRTIYMIGDNPKSDIAGANAANTVSRFEWKSVLLESGVYTAGSIPEHKPTAIKADVKEAVKWIIEQEEGQEYDKKERGG